MLFLLLCLLLPAQTGGPGSGSYDYPIEDKEAATILSTPTEFMPELPEDIPVEKMELTVFKDRVIPEVFWYQEQLKYSLVHQDGPAPLIFVIAGTGANYNSAKMVLLQKVFYQAGYHVISLPSPTYQNFIITASRSSVPGHLVEDAKDLYHVMQLAVQQVADRIEVTDYSITGYSLGAAQAAYVSKLDEEDGVFKFKKVYMINPPVNLFNSVSILDSMLVDNIPGGLDHFDEFFDKIMGKMAKIYREVGYFHLSADFLYEVYRKRQLTADEEEDMDEDMKALIGMSFRISSGNMVFTSDVMSHAGLVVPKNRVLGCYDSLTDYGIVTMRTSFVEYFDELFLPHFREKQPNVTRDGLIEKLGLKPLESYLKNTKKIELVTNEDDLILAPGEVDYLRRVFGSRAKIYPKGGHCGNMGYKDNVEHMLAFFKR